MKKTAVKENNNIITRPPVVVILGHVDHGKSSLLEAIRADFKITVKESGGITQHIGAYEAEHEGKKITFIDTPGHEAFSAVRSRGAKVADIAVLVVAADEGVKPQTKEAVEQIQKAEIPMIVAFSKMDKQEAIPEKIKQELAQLDVYVEAFGGKVPSIETSAITKKGIKELLEMILLVAEVENLTYDKSKAAQGVVLESYIDANRGPAVTLLIGNGELHVGDVVGTSSSMGKVRILENFQGDIIKKGTASMPCLVMGFESCPKSGEQFKVFESEELARAQLSVKEAKERVVVPSSADSDITDFNILIKADVVGSLEVLESVLLAIPQEKVVLRIVSLQVGEIGENDVKLANSTGSRIFGFRTKVNAAAVALAEREDIAIENFDVIYELIQRVRALMEKSLEPEIIRTDLGHMKVLEVFLADKNRQIVGGKVGVGEIRKGVKVEVTREDELVGKGKIVNLQKNKQDVGIVKAGEECGILYEGSVKIQKGDIVSAFVEETQKRKL